MSDTPATPDPQASPQPQHGFSSAEATRLNTPSTSFDLIRLAHSSFSASAAAWPSPEKETKKEGVSRRASHGSQRDGCGALSGEVTRVPSPVPGFDAQEKGEAKPESTQSGPLVGNSEKAKWRLMLDESEDPKQWSNGRKWTVTALVCLIYCTATLTSSIATGAARQYAYQFDVSPFHQSLILTVYMIGLAIAPPIWAPLSETYGRLTVNLISLPGYTLFNIGCALSPSYSSLLVCRFFVGLCGASPQSNSGATISDIWAPAERLWPMFIYTTAAFGGPVLGPTAGGFLAGTDVTSERWRWIYWLLTIMGGISTICVVLIQKETYSPVLLKRKARRLLKEQAIQREQQAALGSSSSTTDIDEQELIATLEAQKLSLKGVLTTHVSRPFKMLLTELPLAYAAAWTSFAYAILFLFFEAFPVVFGETYGFNAGETGLTFLPLAIGILSTVPVVNYFNRLNLQIRRENGGKAPPEARLRQGVLSAPLFVVGFFWFGWTARSSIHWICPILATIPIGAALIYAFNSLSVYVAECYTLYAASALGAMAFSRCIFAVFVPLFGRQMFERLGPGWASSILGFVSLAAVPIPVLFQRYGTAVRQRSRMAVKS